MARPSGQVLEEVQAPKNEDTPRRIWRTAVEQVRAELEEELKARCSIPNPPPHAWSSKNGEYPKARTYEFVDGLDVVYSEQAGAFRVYSHTHDRHGVFLQNGLRDKTTRPYATLIQQERDWNARVNEVAISMLP